MVRRITPVILTQLVIVGVLSALLLVGINVTAQAPPSEPLNLNAITSDGQVTLSWSPPSNDGGSSITNYMIFRGESPGSQTFLTEIGPFPGYTDTSVENGRTYYYTVSAKNSYDEGPRSNEVTADLNGDGSSDGEGMGGFDDFFSGIESTMQWVAIVGGIIFLIFFVGFIIQTSMSIAIFARLGKIKKQVLKMKPTKVQKQLQAITAQLQALQQLQARAGAPHPPPQQAPQPHAQAPAQPYQPHAAHMQQPQPQPQPMAPAPQQYPPPTAQAQPPSPASGPGPGPAPTPAPQQAPQPPQTPTQPPPPQDEFDISDDEW